METVKTARELELEARHSEISEELGAIRDRRRKTETKALIGTCWKLHNHYSCPETDADYWWVYTGFYAKGDEVRAFRFQVDKDGKATVESRGELWELGYPRGEQIGEDEFWAAWRKARAHIGRMAEVAAVMTVNDSQKQELGSDGGAHAQS